jgi:hypothetical protein
MQDPEQLFPCPEISEQIKLRLLQDTEKGQWKTVTVSEFVNLVHQEAAAISKGPEGIKCDRAKNLEELR